ncbi:MAG: mono/diheme cytochrome c family protein, partial [Pirellulaceae bacterium]
MMITVARKVSLLGSLVVAVALLPAIANVVSAEDAAEAAKVATAAKVDFNRDIRPILSDKCFHCHGPDESNREADLRLDSLEGLQADLGGHVAVVPGDVKASALIARINHADPEERMPPADSGRSLTRQQIELITSWVQQGAVWQKHWSFKPPVRPELPAVKSVDWAKNPIDRFVLARLERDGLPASPRAEKETLIRRVTFDLTGLPPTLGAIDTFLADESDDAYESLVDRLLKSDSYGERMAMPWLDAARYADTHGYSLDRRRVMWPWRDWVIWAYNQNMPFDQFMIEQLAGDLLPKATTSQKVATGFNRNHPIQSEGGVINEEYRVETVVDRVETTASVFLGLTMGCCRCHDHKYEPFTQKEFYRFYSLFNNVPESAHVGNSDKATDGPIVKAPSVLQSSQLKQINQQIAELQRRIKIEEAETKKAETKKAAIVERVWIDDAIPAGAETLGNGGGEQKFVFVSKDKHPVYSGSKSSLRTSVGLGQHLVHNAPPLTLNASAKLFSYVYLDPINPPKQIMLQWHDTRGWEHRAYWGENKIPWGKAGSTTRRNMGPLPKAGEWVRLEVDAASVGLAEGSQVAGWAFTQFDGTVYWDKSGVADVSATALGLQLAAFKNRVKTLETVMPSVMVMAEMPAPRKTFVLHRGQYNSPSEVQVTAGIPSVLGSLPADSKRDRLALAKWLASRQNPLTARVTVNRY